MRRADCEVDRVYGLVDVEGDRAPLPEASDPPVLQERAGAVARCCDLTDRTEAELPAEPPLRAQDVGLVAGLEHQVAGPGRDRGDARARVGEGRGGRGRAPRAAAPAAPIISGVNAPKATRVAVGSPGARPTTRGMAREVAVALGSQALGKLSRSISERACRTSRADCGRFFGLFWSMAPTRSSRSSGTSRSGTATRRGRGVSLICFRRMWVWVFPAKGSAGPPRPRGSRAP